MFVEIVYNWIVSFYREELETSNIFCLSGGLLHPAVCRERRDDAVEMIANSGKLGSET